MGNGVFLGAMSPSKGAGNQRPQMFGTPPTHIRSLMLTRTGRARTRTRTRTRTRLARTRTRTKPTRTTTRTRTRLARTRTRQGPSLQGPGQGQGLDLQGQGQGPNLQGPGQGQGLDLQGQGQGQGQGLTSLHTVRPAIKFDMVTHVGRGTFIRVSRISIARGLGPQHPKNYLTLRTPKRFDLER